MLYNVKTKANCQQWYSFYLQYNSFIDTPEMLEESYQSFKN